ncbi:MULTISPECIES: DUF2863 family protein [Cupriavidus]|uniref:DUF2863 family protein n=1 Tax=Cupriavidus metallidurans (strain ATCC 43123 / DSM 2839 / NBRC 102507 / CH34) TaxID=266264 RepID=Q1LKF5_CUPMC|nr:MULTISPECIES: DUF2863 family protein [Cupriavidus]ABF09371.1 conserved hypothetical protein [Cupriavidus metallidurans CH34]EKZ97127.1 hypothetical protein D769_21739 [Cupriavidus sp. HMR-1]QGS29762.1 DUF2863 family protein [Cupriavidus metallidurans]UBM10078.1 DUF2863 family protein [Cupriavidus metallidurans]GMG90785.1 hypothetical protein Cmtc_20050 [Cupriavidus sp. TKC]
MAGFRPKSSARLSPDAERLVADALALDASGSRMEDGYWERRLSQRLHRLLKNGSQTALDAALEHLFKHNADASDVLAEQAETLAESATIEVDGAKLDVLLIAAPILAHTRYAIPSGALKPELAQTLAVHLQAHVLATGTKVALSPYLYSIDQLPRSHSDTFALTHKLATAALAGTMPKVDLRDLPETAPILADPRYLLAVVVAPHEGALFRWQEDAKEHHAERSVCLEQWRQQVQPTVALLLPGCEFELLLPDAFFLSCRESDKSIRPLTVRAAVNYLCGTLDVPAGQLAAVVAGFGEEVVEEYRVGFTMRGEKEVIYGIVWPVYGREAGEADAEEKGNPVEQICEELRNAGVEDIFRHAALFDPEYCEDCGTPLYADRSGEIVHAELPEDAPTQQPLFH